MVGHQLRLAALGSDTLPAVSFHHLAERTCAMFRRNLKRTRLLIAVLILSSFVGCDQVTKQFATATLQNEPAQTYLNETIRLEYALNSGGFLSFGASLSPTTRKRIFIGLNTILLGALTVFLVKRWDSHFVVFASLCYILAGGVGNLIDRVVNSGLVIDFINLGIGPVRTGIFNVADLGVTFGAVALMVCSRRSLAVSPEKGS
jgi:signal peptidase II